MPLNPQQVHHFIPLQAMKPMALKELLGKAKIVELASGKFLFKKGDTDNNHLYLLNGELEFIDNGKILTTMGSTDAEARHPIANRKPRALSARAKSPCVVLSIDSALLDLMLTWEQAPTQAEHSHKKESPAEEDWMSLLLRTPAFHRIPPTNIQTIFMKMKESKVRAGEVIIEQGQEGDYFYFIKSGTCEVLRQQGPGKAIRLAELKTGDSFGEEALISNNPRNATIRMLTDGALMSLAKADFLALLKEPLLRRVDLKQAEELAHQGGQWLDVRLPQEYKNAHLPGSINIPLLTLRLNLPKLDIKKNYIVYCDTASRSSIAAYLMSEHGFEVYLLDGGWQPAEQAA